MSDAVPATAADLARHAREALDGGEAMAAAVVIEGEAAGRRLLVWADRTLGTLGGAELDASAVEAARAVLAGEPGGVREIEAGGAGCTVYLEVFRPPPELVIVGAGHIARPLCAVGAMLGFRVTVLDDRPEFATRERFPEAEEVRRADFNAPLRGIELGPSTHLVLVTRGHKYDYEALRDALARAELPAYIGMVGSRRRTRAALEQLSRDGIASERLMRVHAPIGLDIGAETPEEIAVAIAAEIIRLRRGGTGEPLREKERVVERWITRRNDD